MILWYAGQEAKASQTTQPELPTTTLYQARVSRKPTSPLSPCPPACAPPCRTLGRQAGEQKCTEMGENQGSTPPQGSDLSGGAAWCFPQGSSPRSASSCPVPTPGSLYSKPIPNHSRNREVSNNYEVKYLFSSLRGWRKAEKILGKNWFSSMEPPGRNNTSLLWQGGLVPAR